MSQEQKAQKTQVRKSGKPIGVIRKIGIKEYQIATPKLGVFTSTNLERLKQILKEDGLRPIVKEQKKESD